MADTYGRADTDNLTDKQHDELHAFGRDYEAYVGGWAELSKDKPKPELQPYVDDRTTIEKLQRKLWEETKELLLKGPGDTTPPDDPRDGAPPPGPPPGQFPIPRWRWRK